MPANNKIRSAYVTLPSAERKVADFIRTILTAPCAWSSTK